MPDSADELSCLPKKVLSVQVTVTALPWRGVRTKVFVTVLIEDATNRDSVASMETTATVECQYDSLAKARA